MANARLMDTNSVERAAEGGAAYLCFQSVDNGREEWAGLLVVNAYGRPRPCRPGICGGIRAPGAREVTAWYDESGEAIIQARNGEGKHEVGMAPRCWMSGGGWDAESSAH